MTVVLGAHNIRKKEKSQQRIRVAKYHQHPDYTGEYDYDIMLLQVIDNCVNGIIKTSVCKPKSL